VNERVKCTGVDSADAVSDSSNHNADAGQTARTVDCDTHHAAGSTASAAGYGSCSEQLHCRLLSTGHSLLPSLILTLLVIVVIYTIIIFINVIIL